MTKYWEIRFGLGKPIFTDNLKNGTCQKLHSTILLHRGLVNESVHFPKIQIFCVFFRIFGLMDISQSPSRVVAVAWQGPYYFLKKGHTPLGSLFEGLGTSENLETLSKHQKHINKMQRIIIGYCSILKPTTPPPTPQPPPTPHHPPPPALTHPFHPPKGTSWASSASSTSTPTRGWST